MNQKQKLFSSSSPDKNGQHIQPSLPVYLTPFQDSQPEEFNLRQLLAMVRRRAIVIESVVVAVTAGVWFLTLSQTPQYEGAFRLLVEPVTADSKLAELSQTPNVNATTEKQSNLDYETQIQVLQSPKLLTPLVKRLQTRYPDISYNSLIYKLKLVRFQETKIIEVHYQDTNPQKIQFILEQLAQEYLKYSLQERQTNLRQGSQFVEEQLSPLQLRVNSLQRELQKFRQQYNFIAPETKAEQLTQQLTAIEQQRLDTEKQLAETRASFDMLQGDSGAASALTGAPVYQRLLEQLRDTESKIATELGRFNPNSPPILALREKRDNLLPVLRQEAKRVLGNKLAEVANQNQVLSVRAAAIAKAENSLNQQLQQLPALERQYTDLQRELKIATDSLNRFLEKRESLQVETAQKQVPWQLIAAPELPQVPIAPNTKRNLLLGFLGSLITGLGAALLVERLDHVFHSLDELKDLTKLPLLGVVPFNKELKKPAPLAEAEPVVSKNGVSLVFRNLSQEYYKHSSPFLEAFRALHTNLSFLSSDTPLHSLVISSAVRADGKSTVAVHLAQAAAVMGQRVLLVDADLRLPQIHHLLELPNQEGLSNVISKNLPPIEVIQRSHLSDNLFVLTSGQIPPDPTKLLASKKMQHIMEQLQQEFDLVIYDTPPFVGLADSSLLAPRTEGIMLVVRLGKTDRSTFRQALDGAKISRASVLGLVANGVNKYSFNSYKYY